jgi:hypothetical protein
MLARNVCFEDITKAVNRVDKLGLKRIVPVRTQPAHDDIDNVSIGFESDVPHVFCNLSARRHFAGRTNQIREQQKFLRREILPNAGARCLVPSHVDFQIIDAQMFYLSLGSTAQYRAHAGEQFRKRERLRHRLYRKLDPAGHGRPRHNGKPAQWFQRTRVRYWADRYLLHQVR